ncbi:hypothetical protein GGI01_001644 [Coemansia sp. RSA 376]|nr:hypothetical protein H4S03_001746 [Coemansia sp. S3946]KAJ2074428.1 hypothetical protein GGH13_001330 [Coemansia sp. S155-1]KAJ2114292.1 hypothetical protein IW146_003209 [Coemansia sp. RSA 922]KAJ2262302.1 hypothetical protein GGI01_001644 [Coemansia sp. RSA 376]KAJ2353694.1 hypothetical protein GGH92_000495 [Coemansia sp. RSA 2673]
MHISLGQLVLTYILGILTIPALLIAGVALFWVLLPSAEPFTRVLDISDAASAKTDEAKNLVKPAAAQQQADSLSRQPLSSPYGERRMGWLRITRSLDSHPPELVESHTKFTDIVARGFAKWMHTKRSNSSAGTGKRSDSSGAGGSGPPPDAYQQDMYYVVLNGDTLVMYDGEAMGECRGVIIMTKYRVSLHHSEGTSEAQVYSRRTPIRLSPVDDSVEASKYKRQVAEYFVYADRPVDKEDWYFALMWSSLTATATVSSDEEGDSSLGHAPLDSDVPGGLGGNSVTPLASPSAHTNGATFNINAHSGNTSAQAAGGQELTAEQRERRRLRMRRTCLVPDSVGIGSILQTISARGEMSTGQNSVRQDEWLNAMLGRVFLGAYRTEWARRHFIRKMQAKFDRVQRPVFLDKIVVADLDIGDNVPIITSPKLESFDANGLVDTSMYVHYKGGFRLVLNTGVKLGSLRMSVSLAVVLESLAGKMLVRMKPSPSNRFWTGFYEMPSIRISLSPVFMQKKVKYAVVSQAIEKQIYDILRQTLVLPNMDDTVFFPTFVDDGAILERSLKEYKDQALGDDEICLDSDDDDKSHHSGKRESVAGHSKSDQSGSERSGEVPLAKKLDSSEHTTPDLVQKPRQRVGLPSTMPEEDTSTSTQDQSDGQRSSDGDSAMWSEDYATPQENLSSSRLAMDSPQQLSGHSSSISNRDIGSQKSSTYSRSTLGSNSPSRLSPSPANSIAQQARSVSLKSTLSLSAASLLKRAKDSQAAESAKTWWQNIQQANSSNNSSGPVKSLAVPSRPTSDVLGISYEGGGGGVGLSDEQSGSPVQPLRNMSPLHANSLHTARPAVGASPRLPRYDESVDEYELPLSSSAPHVASGSSSARPSAVAGSGEGSSTSHQFPRLPDGSVSSSYSSNYANRGSNTTSGADSSLVRRRPAALSMGSEIELPLHRRYSIGKQHQQQSPPQKE